MPRARRGERGDAFRFQICVTFFFHETTPDGPPKTLAPHSFPPGHLALANISAATRAVTSGMLPRGRAVVAMTKVQSSSASKVVSHRLASARSQSAAQEKRYASSHSGA